MWGIWRIPNHLTHGQTRNAGPDVGLSVTLPVNKRPRARGLGEEGPLSSARSSGLDPAPSSLAEPVSPTPGTAAAQPGRNPRGQ